MIFDCTHTRDLALSLWPSGGSLQFLSRGIWLIWDEFFNNFYVLERQITLSYKNHYLKGANFLAKMTSLPLLW